MSLNEKKLQTLQTSITVMFYDIFQTHKLSLFHSSVAHAQPGFASGVWTLEVCSLRPCRLTRLATETQFLPNWMGGPMYVRAACASHSSFVLACSKCS